MSADWQQSYDARLRLPEDLQDIEQVLNTVSEKRDELANIPRYRTASVEEYQDVQEFRRAAERWADEIRASGRRVRDSRTARYRQYAAEVGTPRNILNLAVRLNSTTYAKRVRNRDYNNFLLDNADTLRPFYPSLYPNELLEILGRRNR